MLFYHSVSPSTCVDAHGFTTQTHCLGTCFINIKTYKDQLPHSIGIKKASMWNRGTYCLARNISCWGASSLFTSEFSTFWTRRLYSLTFGVRTAKG